MSTIFSVLSSLKRYLFGDMDGLIGKVNQHLNTYNTDINNLPLGEDIISNELISQLSCTPVIFNKGSIAYIYKSIWNNQDIIIKVVSEKIINNINDEISTINLLGNIKSNITSIRLNVT